MGYLLFLSSVAALGGFLFGYDTSVISGTITAVSTQFSMGDLATGWYVGSAIVGSIAGVAIAGRLSDVLGRKRVLWLSALLFSVSAAGCMVSGSFNALIIYRIVGGMGIGIASVVSPLYISEISVPRYRGTLVSLYQLAITVGFLAAYLANYGILRYADSQSGLAGGLWARVFVSESWRGMLGVELLPAALFMLVLLFIPESPRWLILKSKEDRARGILTRLSNAGLAGDQIRDMRLLLQEEQQSNWRLLFRPGFRLALFIGISLAILGQFMGVNAVLYYGPSIFQESGLSEGDSLFYQVFIGLVNFLSTVLAMWLIDRIGRKRLIYIGVSGMMVSLFLIGLYFSRGGMAAGSSPVVLLVLLLVYIFSCAISICVVIWVLLSEMYPARFRGTAMSFAGMSLWVGTFLIGQLTPWLMTQLSPAGVFWLFGVMCIPYLLITWRLIPETTGKSLEDIERHWLSRSQRGF